MKKLEKYISKELFEKLEKFLGNYNHENDFVGGIIFNGNKNLPTESIILNAAQLKCIGRIEEEPYFDQNVISEYASLFRDNLLELQ